MWELENMRAGSVGWAGRGLWGREGVSCPGFEERGPQEDSLGQENGGSALDTC